MVRSTDYLRHTCPAADDARTTALHELAEARRAVGQSYELDEQGSEALDELERICTQIIEDLHDTNHGLRDELRGAMDSMADTINQHEGTIADLQQQEARADRLEADLSDAQDALREAERRADRAEDEANSWQRECARAVR